MVESENVCTSVMYCLNRDEIMTIFRNKKDDKLYIVEKGPCGKFTGDIYIMKPYNRAGKSKEISESYFEKYLVLICIR